MMKTGTRFIASALASITPSVNLSLSPGRRVLGGGLEMKKKKMSDGKFNNENANAA